MTDGTGANEPDRRTRLLSDRRTRLLGVKLQTLVGDHLAATERKSIAAAAAPFALGAALNHDGHAWVLLDSQGGDGRGLGPALAWAIRRGAESLDVVADEGTEIFARRAETFAFPINVWRVEGRALDPAVVAGFEREREPRDEHLRFIGDIEAAGATPLVEHGVVSGEVRGLEVCRVVDVEGAAGTESQLDVGVGVHDREAFAIMHAGVPSSEALMSVVASVSAVRDRSVPAHPLNRLAPERFLRWRLEQEPWLVDMAAVRHAEPPVPRRNLTDRVPCTARGQRVDGRLAVIVCSVGVDLDVIPYAADARLAAERERPARVPTETSDEPGNEPIEVLVVVPRRDAMAVTKDLAGRLRRPVTLVTLPGS